MNLINIFTSLKIKFYIYYITPLFFICQQKLYDKIRQIATEATIPAKSASSAANKTNLVFFIPTHPVYTAIVYSVVSVDPIIVDVINPRKVSVPYFCIISTATPIEALPDIGLKSANGIISLGIFKISVTGEITFTIKSIIPEFLKAPTATKIPINVGIN